MVTPGTWLCAHRLGYVGLTVPGTHGDDFAASSSRSMAITIPKCAHFMGLVVDIGLAFNHKLQGRYAVCMPILQVVASHVTAPLRDPSKAQGRRLYVVCFDCDSPQLRKLGK